ncbi:MAG: hypothetical protein ACYCW6_24405 [Candidatus Xenobia bacterium]
MLTPGTILAGRYQVERVLGRGGTSLVYAARQLSLEELGSRTLRWQFAWSHGADAALAPRFAHDVLTKP